MLLAYPRMCQYSSNTSKERRQRWQHHRRITWVNIVSHLFNRRWFDDPRKRNNTTIRRKSSGAHNCSLRCTESLWFTSWFASLKSPRVVGKRLSEPLKWCLLNLRAIELESSSQCAPPGLGKIKVLWPLWPDDTWQAKYTTSHCMVACAPQLVAPKCEHKHSERFYRPFNA